MNLDDLLKITPSKEGRLKIILKAFEAGDMMGQEHLETAMKHYEQIGNYSKAAQAAEKLGDDVMAELYRSCVEEK